MSSTATVSVPPVAAPMRQPLPAQIGKYRVLGRLGDGATSEVFLGFDDFQGRNVAIKRVRASTAADPIDGHYSERFFAAEAALVGRLQHPNVVQIFDAVPDPVAPYLVMEYVAGEHAAPVLPRRPAAVARADRRDRLQVRDGARLRLPPGPDPPRRQAGQPAGGAQQRPDHRRQDHRLRQRAEPRLRRDPDPPRRLARLHVAGAARRRHARLPRRHLLARRGALPPDRRPAAVRRAGAVGHDASDLQRQAGAAGRHPRRRARGARRA